MTELSAAVTADEPGSDVSLVQEHLVAVCFLFLLKKKKKSGRAPSTGADLSLCSLQPLTLQVVGVEATGKGWKHEASQSQEDPESGEGAGCFPQVSLLAFSAMALLTIMEFLVYRDTWMKYEYEVDKDFSSKLKLNIDITVAMKCQYIGADVLDLAETMITSAEGLVYEPVTFDLSPQQRQWQRMLQQIQNRLQEQLSLQDLLFKSAMKSSVTALPPREDKPTEPPNACRIHGNLDINKVAGNFHITVGKAIPHPRGHAHLAALVSHDSYNFSHRIDHFSFGELLPGIINPLDGTEKIALDSNQMYQYFITIVPTKLNTRKVFCDHHQFSVTERERVINHATGSHGVSGIFMKYDISSLMVTVTEDHMPLWKFLVRLCGIIGGIFTTTGMIHGLAEFFVDLICCRFRLGAYRPLEDNHIGGISSNHCTSENFPPDPL